ncbi:MULTISPECIES: hypothetical protein [Nocardia]|uniref:hypothetical protein n=1 Tax=Nocardia TaxID=1817 RepID=UPI001E59982C|nr:hypothetical protein [Nocardia asteroides]UGT63452.1 hypothetical protein LTT61_09130 [Nocardia asteroides]
MRRTRAVEIQRADLTGYEAIGTVELALNRYGHSDIHRAVEEIARAATAAGGDHFYVAESLGDRIVAVVCRRR